MKIAETILKIAEESREYKGIDYDIEKTGSHYHAEIEREEIEGTKAKSIRAADTKAKAYIDQVI